MPSVVDRVRGTEQREVVGMVTRIDLNDGKYTVVHDNGSDLHALRYGEPWRTMVGDNLILSMVSEIEELRARIKQLEDTNELLESFRPHWAEGNTSDGVAAQTYLGALVQIYNILGVDNQTEAVIKLESVWRR